MSALAQADARRMTVAEFLEWSQVQPEGRFELVDGVPIAMSPETSLHALVKGAVFRALGDAVAAAGLDCTVFPDGMTVVVGPHQSREPDAAVQCGSAPRPDSLTLDAPVIVVEVTSPSTSRIDVGDKLIEYFSVPSIMHYLIVHPRQPAVVHHRRSEDGDIRTRIVREGKVELSPPGFAVTVEAMLGPASDPRSAQE